MLTKLKGCKTLANKMSDIGGGAIFGRHGHNLNKLGRGSQDECYKHNIKALGLVVSDPETSPNNP